MKNFGFLIVLLLSISTYSQDKISLTYTGNMGVLISDGKVSVLIDGLHEKYGADYLFPPQALVQKIGSGFNGNPAPSLLLFTHRHGDHYSARLADNFLKEHPSSMLIGPGQVTSQLQKQERAIKVATDSYAKQLFAHRDILVKAFKMNHGGARHKTVENTAFIISLGGLNILHIGDTSWHEDIKMFDQLGLNEEDIDYLVIPYWMLLGENAEELLEKYLDGVKLIATHISPRIDKKDLNEIKKRYPKTVFLTQLEEKLKL
ncbi:hypothetical protein GWK08_11770 [Leptobacterium flavescens]|uniref:MBL fold metallo-hydrolase n=1 Tax=Leptobacterium flavescens TaxID=472055 RepID=A0A6P0UNP8_9FLAO|nr:MBL fold metallo-hydrolase [Leptobacterium flavescens]NER14122.1 hypothetical protein [Leptobacterium flavescens]